MTDVDPRAWLGDVLARITDQPMRCPDETRGKAWRTLIAELVPSKLPSNDYVEAICGSLTRSGLLVVFSGFGNLVNDPTPQMDELAEMVDFEEALAEER